MKNEVIARNYAEALLAVALQENAVERYGALLDSVGGVVETDARVKAVLMAPATMSSRSPARSTASAFTATARSASA